MLYHRVPIVLTGLTLNVIAPADATPESKLPIVVWIYGGAFEIGATEQAGVGNLGLHDQRLALYWVQKYIGAFRGYPTKVTIAGAISIALHMVTNSGNSDGLFRAAFMQSGSPFFVGDIAHGQKHYEALVDETGCSTASDTLQCLREAPYEIPRKIWPIKVWAWMLMIG
ncbi:Alpha/Beta hydrolase protein [Melanogaster broomeanus]|nr:Alpha/Beta hydrolase protein [Melanogaster broomeanus]